MKSLNAIEKDRQDATAGFVRVAVSGSSESIHLVHEQYRASLQSIASIKDLTQTTANYSSIGNDIVNTAMKYTPDSLFSLSPNHLDTMFSKLTTTSGFPH